MKIYTTPAQDAYILVRLRERDLRALSSRLYARMTARLGTIWLNCPEPFCNSTSPNYSLWEVMVHLNDGHGWPRENIADWLDTLPYDLTLTHPNPDRA